MDLPERVYSWARCRGESLQTLEVHLRHRGCCLDFDPDHTAGRILEHNVDFLAGFGAEMMKLRLPTAPTRLFLELQHDHEVLKQRAQEHPITPPAARRPDLAGVPPGRCC